MLAQVEITGQDVPASRRGSDATAMKRYDAIVIGAGHNGLTTAAYLARAGKSVLVLERRHLIGGAAVSEELYPGFTYSTCSYVCSLLRPEIIRDLDLPSHGLQILPYGWASVPVPGGRPFISYPDHDRTWRSIELHSKRDAEGYDAYGLAMMRQCRFIRPLLMVTPPDPAALTLGDLKTFKRIWGAFSEMGEETMYEILRFWTMSCADLLDEYFETEVIKAYLAGSATVGTMLGVRSPGSAYVLLHHFMGELDGDVGAWGFVRGAMGGVSRAIGGAAEAAGCEIRVSAEVSTVIVKDGKAVGVVLADGEEIYATAIVSNLDPKATFLRIDWGGALDDDFLDMTRRFKSRGSSGKLNIALDGLPIFPHIADERQALKGSVFIGHSMDYLERAYDDAKYGRWSDRPWIEMEIPSTIDPTLAPPGKHMMSVFVQYVPSQLADGPWDDAKRDAFGQHIIDRITEVAPDFKDLILHAQVRSPADIEREVGITDGNIFHGELTMDQLLFNRPFPGYAKYRGPVAHSYMCGSSTHLGGGVMAAPGANAAREILDDFAKGELT